MQCNFSKPTARPQPDFDIGRGQGCRASCVCCSQSKMPYWMATRVSPYSTL